MSNKRKSLRISGRRVLIVDQNGYPKYWTTPKKAIRYVVTKKVVFTMGELLFSYPGFSDVENIDVFEIMAVHSPKHITGSSRFSKEPTITNTILFARDGHCCAYCGNKFPTSKLSRDHIVPRRAGGKDVWLNLITACKPCNHKKGHKMPGTRGAPHLIFKPRVPKPIEAFAAINPSITPAQVDYLSGFCKTLKDD